MNKGRHTNWKFYYRPLAAFQGTVLKCAGHGAESPEHRDFFTRWYDDHTENGVYLPGVQVLTGYHGDRIDVKTHEVVNEG